MSEDDGDIQVAFDEAGSRYVITVEGTEAGVADVELREDRAVFTHTEVSELFGGRGLGKVLVAHALADVAARGLAVEPQCSFVRAYLARNPDAARLAD